MFVAALKGPRYKTATSAALKGPRYEIARAASRA